MCLGIQRCAGEVFAGEKSRLGSVDHAAQGEVCATLHEAVVEYCVVEVEHRATVVEGAHGHEDGPCSRNVVVDLEATSAGVFVIGLQGAAID